MRTSTTTAELSKALAAAQGEFPPIEKDKTVTVQKKTGGQYTFKYAELSSIIAATHKIMAKHGLSILSAPVASPEGMVLTTRLSHASGEWVEGDFPLTVGVERVQDLGAQLTYFRRYAMTGLLNVSTDDDVDGGGGDLEMHGPAKPAKAPKTGSTAPVEPPPPAPAASSEPQHWSGKVQNVQPKIYENQKYLDVLGLDEEGKASTFVIKAPPEKDKARLDIYKMQQTDLSQAAIKGNVVDINFIQQGKARIVTGMEVYPLGEEPKL